MSDYISRQAAIIEMMDNDVDHAQGIDGRETVQILSDIPAADVVPVVRCRNCARLNRNGYCTRFQNNISGIATSWFMPEDDDFCSYGERREE